MKSLLCILMRMILTILILTSIITATANADELFINRHNSKTITLKKIQSAFKHGVDIHARDKDGNTLLMWASMKNSDPKIIGLLLNLGV